MNNDHKPFTVSGFLGMYDRGDETIIPQRHQRDLVNMMFRNDRLVKRGGFRRILTTSRNYVRFYEAHFKSGRQSIFFDGTHFYAGTDQLPGDFSGATDFTALNMNNRLFIAPNVGKVQVYDGTTMRDLGGEGPPLDNIGYDSSSLFYPSLLASGDVTADPFISFNYLDIGRYIVAISYNIGNYITNPGYIRSFYVSDLATNRLRLLNLPSDLPVNVTGITISLTRLFISADDTMNTDVVNQKFTRRYTDNQFWFVPFGRVKAVNRQLVDRDDNALTHIDIPHATDQDEYDELVHVKYIFFNGHLLLESTYLIDQLASISDVKGLAEYNDRLILFKDDKIWASQIDDPESIATSKRVGIESPGDIKNAFSYKDLLYICKEYSTYSTFDNGEDVATWRVVTVDRGLGADTHSVGSVRGFEGPTEDYVFIGNKQGLCLFDGKFSPIEASWKIKAFWDRITDHSRTQVLLDTANKLVYCLVVIDSVYFVLVLNYQKGIIHQEATTYNRNVIVGGPRWSRIIKEQAVIRSIGLDDENRLIIMTALGNKTEQLCMLEGHLRDDDFDPTDETYEEHYINNGKMSIQGFIDDDANLSWISPIPGGTNSEKGISAIIDHSNIRPNSEILEYHYGLALVRCKGGGSLQIYDIKQAQPSGLPVNTNYETIREILDTRGEDMILRLLHRDADPFELSQLSVYYRPIASWL